MKKYSAIYLFLLFIAATIVDVSGQKQPNLIQVSSAVTDEEGKGIYNALVSGNNGATEVRTDRKGQFTIQVPANSTLLIQAVGFADRILFAGESAEAITLEKVLFLMDQSNQINIPFGSERRRETTGAVSTFAPGAISKYDNVQTFDDVLRGRIPGLYGSSNIRGIGNAVFVVDGFVRDPSILNVEEIAEITVLKDANAAVMYGVHAPNGVVLITTKRGEPFKRRLNLVAETGMSSPRAMPNYLGSADYMRLYNEARANDGLAASFDDATIENHASGINPYQFPNVDFYSSEYLNKTRPFTKVLSEFSGGNKTTQYYTHLGFINTGTLNRIGDAASANTNRFNVRSNVNIDVTSFIKATFDVVAAFNINRSPVGDFWSDAATSHPYRFSPLLPLSLVKSNVGLSDGVSLVNSRLVNGEYLLGGNTIFRNNVYGNQAMGSYETVIQRTAQLNQGLHIDLNRLTEGLSLKTAVGLDVRNAYSQSVNNQYAVYQPTWESNASGVDSISAITKIGTDLRTGVQNLGDLNFARRFGVQAMLDYARTFNEFHSVSGTLLGYFDQFNFEALLVPQRQAHLGLRVNYDYKKKYFVNFSSAYVNGYKLAPGNKGGFSPTVGLGWVVRDEGFQTTNSAIDYLKINASAGILNYEIDGTDYMRYAETFGTYNGSFSWDDGIRTLTTVTLQRAANPGLTFEKMKSLNLGFESYLFKKSLFVDLNVFSTRNTGQVVQRGIYAAHLGNNIPFENFNETRFRGIEMGINWSQSVGALTVDVGMNALYSRSKEIKRDEIWQEDYQYREGRSRDAIFGLVADGFFNDEADIAASPIQMFGEVRPGDIKYKDQNGDGRVDANDAVQIGNSQPKLVYGLTFQMKYRNLSLFALGTGQAGSDRQYSGSYFWVQGDDKYSDQVLNRWTPATAATATYPRLSSVNSNNNFRNSTFWQYRDNSFTLSRIQLTYDMPAGVARRLVSKEVSFFLRGENVARVSQESTKRQIRVGTEPLYRNFSIGARFKF